MLQALHLKNIFLTACSHAAAAGHTILNQFGLAMHESELVCEGAIHIQAAPKADRADLLHDLTEFGLDALPLVVALNPSTGMVITVGKMAEGLYQHAGDGHTVARVFADACVDVVSDPLSAAMSGFEVVRDLEHAGQVWESNHSRHHALH